MGITTGRPKGTLEVFNALKEAADDMRTVTYGELAKCAGIEAHTEVPRCLDYISSEACEPRDLPVLVALAVNQETRRPGKGFLTGLDLGPQAEAWWRGMVLLVYATDWSRIELPTNEEVAERKRLAEARDRLLRPLDVG